MELDRGKWIALGVVVAGVMSFAGAAGDQAASQSELKPLVTVGLELRKGEAAFSVDGKPVEAGALKQVLLDAKRREQDRPAVDRRDVCELVVEKGLPYKMLAQAMIGCAQADVQKVVFRNAAGERFSYHMPAIDREGKPTTNIELKLARVEGTTVMYTGDVPVNLGDLDSAKMKAEMAAFFAEERASAGERTALVLRPTGDVPAQDVLRMYEAATKARFAHVAFSPPPELAGKAPTTAAAANRVGLRVVYIVDRSEAVADGFEQLKEELLRSCDNLTPAQSFNVIMLGEKSESLLPEISPGRAERKREVRRKLGELKAEGSIAGKLEPFRDAFQQAFAMKPDLIYLISASTFDPKLPQVVAELNKDRKVRVNVIAFITKDRKVEDQYKDLAKRAGGLYKYISPADAKEAAPRAY